MPTLVFTVLLIPSFNVLRDYLYVSLNLLRVPTVRIYSKICDMAPLIVSTSIKCFCFMS